MSNSEEIKTVYDEDGNLTVSYTYKNGKKVEGGIIDKVAN